MTPDLWDAADVAAHRDAVLDPATAETRPVIVVFTRGDAELTCRFPVATSLKFGPVVFNEHHAVCRGCDRVAAQNTTGCTAFVCAACTKPWPCPTHAIDEQVAEYAAELAQLPTAPEGDHRL